MAVLVPIFPAPNPPNIKSLRFYQTGVATANFTDNKWAFVRIDPVDVGVPEQAWSYSIQVRAVTANVEISFDGTNVHGLILAGTQSTYEKRHEGGISVRGVGATFYVEAW